MRRNGVVVTTPMLAPGLEVVVIPDGIAVVNGGPPVLFQGRAANEVLVPLLNALDGVLNAQGLATQIGIPTAHVERGLALLEERGLLAPD
ncbi:MAG: hypothetical protein QOF21_3108 [Actinomycetota bacterium]|jgi:hypothetical protein